MWIGDPKGNAERGREDGNDREREANRDGKVQEPRSAGEGVSGVHGR
jgi:hypothetical protein